MIPDASLEKLVQERLHALRREADLWRLAQAGRPSLRRRVALELKAIAEKLEPELVRPVPQPYVRPVSSRGRAL